MVCPDRGASFGAQEVFDVVQGGYKELGMLMEVKISRGQLRRKLYPSVIGSLTLK